MNNLVQKVALSKVSNRVEENFGPGDTVNVHVKVKEGEKERIQQFKGSVIKAQGHGVGRTFTVRKMSFGVGVERTFPFCSPSVSKVEVVTRGKVRKSKLYYLRGLQGRAARIETELYVSEENSSDKK